MEIHRIHNERDYEEALRIVSGLADVDPALGTPDGDRFEILATLVERYEAEHFPLDLPDPGEAI
jgi:HTH-type transcriptional regulator/antitoxin HigA